MGRSAILFANSVAYGETSKNISRGVIRSHTNDLAKQLQSLDEEYAFECETVIDEPTSQAREVIRQAIKKVGKRGDTLLFYYFGHALKHPFKNELYFLSPDSELDDPGGMLKFSDIVGWLVEYQPTNSIIILDCCYAGTVSERLHLSGLAGNYYLMASVNAKDKAKIDDRNDQPYGIFSKRVGEAFTDPRARDTGRNVTFKSFFKYVKDGTESALGQKPYSVDGNLADALFFRQTSTPNIQAGVRSDVPKKSIYQKLFIIGNALSEISLQSEKFLYGNLRRGRKVVMEPFLQPFKTSSNVLEYHFVSSEAFHGYIRIGTLLGIIENREDSLLRLTAKGRNMITGQGRNYNIGLFNLLQEYWATHGLQVSIFEDAIHLRITRGDPPAFEAIHRDLALSGLIGIPKQLFRILFELTAHVGALNYSAEKTFFPPASDQERLLSF